MHEATQKILSAVKVYVCALRQTEHTDTDTETDTSYRRLYVSTR